MRHEFEPTDAWLLCAIAFGKGRPVTLREWIGAADHVNCTVPSLEELNGAILRLGRAGLVRRIGAAVAVTSAAQRFHAEHATKPAARALFDL